MGMKYKFETSTDAAFIEGGNDILLTFSGEVLSYDSKQRIITVEVDDTQNRFTYDTLKLRLDYCVTDSKTATELKKEERINFSFISDQPRDKEEICINSFHLCDQ